MKRSIASLAASACFVALLGSAGPAHAQNFVTFVSDSGSDTNDCTSIAQACRQLAGDNGALAKTPSGGVIHVLPGEYTAFPVVDKSVDIIADAGQASVVNTVAGPIENITGNAGIVIVVGAGDVVRVRGFIVNANHGIAISSAGGIVHLEDDTFIGVSDRCGVIYQPSGASELYIRNTTVAREDGATGGGGILIKPVGAGSAKVVLDDVSVEDNTSGVIVDGRQTTGTISATLRNSVVSGSTGNGVFAVDSGAGSTAVMIEGSSISHNGANGIIASAANATVRVRNSTITGNAKGLAPGAGSKIISVGGNVVDGNTTNGAFSSTVGQI